MRRLKNYLLVLLAATPLLLVATAPASVYATAKSDIQCGINAAAGGSDCAVNTSASSDLSSTIKKILNILSAVAGIAAVVMIIVAGARLVTSAGNEAGVKSAKSTLVYAVVGIVIVALAQIIVHFVITTASNS